MSSFEGPHPAVGSAGELADDVAPQDGRERRVPSEDTGRGAKGLGVRLPLEPRAAVGEPERKKRHQVQKGHHDVAVATPLAEVDALMTERDEPRQVIGLFPAIGHVEHIEENGVVAGQKLALGAEREHLEQHVDETREPLVRLRTMRKLGNSR